MKSYAILTMLVVATGLAFYVVWMNRSSRKNYLRCDPHLGRGPFGRVHGRFCVWWPSARDRRVPCNVYL